MPRESPRTRRLRTDFRELDQLRHESSIVDFEAFGNPPDSYLIKFKGRGLYRPTSSSKVAILNEHQVSISLNASYPRLMPELQWKTPIFHPNISGSGVVCLGGYGTYWVPSLNLDELCEMLWDMIRFANFDVESPYNREAANWAKVQSEFRLPVDPRPIRDRLATGEVLPDMSQFKRTSSDSDLFKQKPAPAKPPADPEPPAITFIDAPVVEAEIVDEGDDDDILIIE